MIARLSLLALLLLLPPGEVGGAGDTPRVEVRRLPGNPILRPDMLPGADGRNINGPSLIRVPSWVRSPLGRIAELILPKP